MSKTSWILNAGISLQVSKCLLTKSSQTTYHQFRHRFRNWELNYYNIVVEVENNCIYSVQSCKITPNCSFPNQLTGYYLLVYSLPPFYQVIYYKDSLFTSVNLMIVLCVYISGTQKLKIILGIIQPEPSSLWSENIWDNCNLGPFMRMRVLWKVSKWWITCILYNITDLCFIFCVGLKRNFKSSSEVNVGGISWQ